ncbi:MAG: hypothetical protein ACE5K4_05815 [Candidatus Hydrothermarchaeota archaeon]
MNDISYEIEGLLVTFAMVFIGITISIVLFSSFSTEILSGTVSSLKIIIPLAFLASLILTGIGYGFLYALGLIYIKKSVFEETDSYKLQKSNKLIESMKKRIEELENEREKLFQTLEKKEEKKPVLKEKRRLLTKKVTIKKSTTRDVVSNKRNEILIKLTVSNYTEEKLPLEIREWIPASIELLGEFLTIKPKETTVSEEGSIITWKFDIEPLEERIIFYKIALFVRSGEKIELPPAELRIGEESLDSNKLTITGR